MLPEDQELEGLLLRYRPVGPPGELRERVQGVMEGAGRRWRVYLFRAGVAAVLVGSVGLLYAAEKLERLTAAEVGAGAARWTGDAEETARIVELGGAGRAYVASCLTGGKGIRGISEGRFALPLEN